MFFDNKKRRKEINLKGDDDNISVQSLEIERKTREEFKNKLKYALFLQSLYRSRKTQISAKKDSRKTWTEFLSVNNAISKPLTKEQVKYMLNNFNFFYNFKNKEGDFDRLLLQSTILFKNKYLPSNELTDQITWLTLMKKFLKHALITLENVWKDKKFNHIFTLILKMIAFYTDAKSYLDIDQEKIKQDICSKIFSLFISCNFFRIFSDIYKDKVKKMKKKFKFTIFLKLI